MEKDAVRAVRAEALANEFIMRAFMEGVPIGIIKTVRLVYVAHGASLALRGVGLVSSRVDNERWGADYACVKAALVEAPTEDVDRLCADGRGRARRADLDDASRAIVDQVWSVFKGFEAHSLSALTRPRLGAVRRHLASIDDETTRRHFAAVFAPGAADAEAA